jgi:hypothetical protein
VIQKVFVDDSLLPTFIHVSGWHLVHSRAKVDTGLVSYAFVIRSSSQPSTVMRNICVWPSTTLDSIIIH